ncbi:MAG: VCBS repeat-containing protein, partial [Chloroflexi bacterium]|nr:VCBS repeat-containing protein [Chloroflexota bacterium]
IATSANGAESVYAADMDNDGDMDILSASRLDDTIAWYENDGAADPSFTASDIATSANGARSVYAADMDNDGDMDILSASANDNTIAWYENDGAIDPSFSASNIATSAAYAKSVYAADMDNDGDMDILSASWLDDTIAWYENEGGSADFIVTDSSISSGFIPDGEEDDVMQVVFTHNGIAADRDLELGYWNLDLLASDCSSALTSAQANASLAALRVRLDDGDDVFEVDGSDVQVGIVSSGSFSLDGNGAQKISFTNNDSNVQVSGTNSATYWISFEAPVDAGQLGICAHIDPDADMLVEGKTPDFSVSIQDSTGTTTTNTLIGSIMYTLT